MHIAQEIQSLLRQLVPANEAYRNGSPIMDDPTYDALEDRLRALVGNGAPDTPIVQAGKRYLAQVGAKVPAKSPWPKVKHTAPMGSLNKAQDIDAFLAWEKSCEDDWDTASAFSAAGPIGARLISDKCDGISIALYYEDGQLVRAVTRGDGEEGEDILPNVLRMEGVVPYIKDMDGDMRAEIVLRKSMWKKHFPEFANPRNAAAGIAKRMTEGGSEYLTVLHYRIRRTRGKPIPDKVTQFRLMEALGCELPNWTVVSTSDEVKALYDEYIQGKREALDYDIDGLVIEYVNPDVMDSLGMLNKRPKGAVALKFPHDKKTSTLRNIRWQVGASGRVTPVAEFDKVDLAGAQVVQASLHNISNITRLVTEAGAKGYTGIPADSEILVSRRNDVIPYVEKVIALGSGALLEPPTHCPSCSTDLTREGEYLVCPAGFDCPAQVAGGISRWCSKIGLKGWGDSVIEVLVETGMAKEPGDLYVLDPDNLAQMPLSGRVLGSTAHTIMQELRDKSDLPLHVFVGSLGIPLCARSICKTIVDAGFDTLDKMRAASVAEISGIPRVGPTKGQAFVDGVAARTQIMDNLLANGVTIKPPADGPFKGKSVCMTGFRDPSMSSAIEAAGGTVKSGVSKGLTILVARDPSGTSGKLGKARKYGTEIIDPDEMWDRLGGRS